MQNTKQSHRSMTEGEYRITMKLKQSLVSLPRLDFLAFKPLQGPKYAIESGLCSTLMYHRKKQLTNTLILLLIVDMLLLYLYYQTETKSLLGTYWLPLSFAVHIANTSIVGLLIRAQYEENAVRHRANISIPLAIVKLVFFLVIHPGPLWGDLTIDLSYDDYDYENFSFLVPFNHLIIIATFLKNILLCSMKYLVNTIYLNPRGKRLKNLFSIQISEELFAVKCIFKETPIKMFIIFYLVSYFFFSFAFQITESRVPLEANPFTYFDNCLWFTIITVTTVGYGDLHPYTHVGYMLNVCCMVWGTLATSCILVILINTLTLNPKEEEALSSLKRVETELEYRYLCKHYLRISLWRVWSNYRDGGKRHERTAERRMRLKLSQLRKEKKMQNPSTNIAELSQHEFDNAIINAAYLRCNNQQLINFINSHIFSQVLIREHNISPSEQFIDRSKEKEFEDKIQEGIEGNNNGRASEQSQTQSAKSLVQSVSSISQQSDYRQMSRLSAIRPHKAQYINVEDLQSHSDASEIIKEDGI